jgi:hypothetical protein
LRAEGNNNNCVQAVASDLPAGVRDIRVMEDSEFQLVAAY